MKRVFATVAMAFIFNASLFAQRNVEVQVRVNNAIPTNGAFIFFPLLNDTINLSGRSSVLLDTSIKEKRLFYAVCNDKKSRFYNLNDKSIVNNYLNFKIADSKYFDSFYKIRSCPLCHRNEHVIPYVYGKPSKETLDAAERGEIKLAGCGLSNTSPYYYCNYDHLEF
jgi:hypothetical protein